MINISIEMVYFWGFFINILLNFILCNRMNNRISMLEKEVKIIKTNE